MSTVRAPNDSFWLKSAKLKENREKLQNAVYSGQKDGFFFGIDKKLENFIGVVKKFRKVSKTPGKVRWSTQLINSTDVLRNELSTS